MKTLTGVRVLDIIVGICLIGVIISILHPWDNPTKDGDVEPETKGGLNTREILDGKGWECECPFCNETNQARYDEDGRLISWPNTEIGTWCSHATGAYAGAKPTGAPQFLFR